MSYTAEPFGGGFEKRVGMLDFPSTSTKRIHTPCPHPHIRQHYECPQVALLADHQHCVNVSPEELNLNKIRDSTRVEHGLCGPLTAARENLLFSNGTNT